MKHLNETGGTNHTSKNYSEQLANVYMESDVKFSENKITSSQTLGKLHDSTIKWLANEVFLA